MSGEARSALFPALLRYWRRARGLSQLDLSVASDVSARHISFLETGRAEPSRGMVLRLASALDVPLRDTNDLLRAAGHPEAFEEPGIEASLDGPLGHAVERMLRAHEPYPLVVVNRGYELVRANRGAQWLTSHFVADPDAVPTPLNLFRALFDPRLFRPFVEDFETIAQALLLRLHREALHEPRNSALRSLQEELRSLATDETRQDVDLGQISEPTFNLTLVRDGLRLSFFGAVTVFSAPQNVTVQELRIESFYPADDATEAHFRTLG